jgi:hypothetical protein
MTHTTADSVLAVIKDKHTYHIRVEYCYPEALHPNDWQEIQESADCFRDSVTLEQVEQEMEECRWLWADGEPSPEQVASFIMDSNADHGIYQTITISLEQSSN